MLSLLTHVESVHMEVYSLKAVGHGRQHALPRCSAHLSTVGTAGLALSAAMALDLASPLLPGSCFMLLVSLASVARAMVGMASGATHAALTQHFAAKGSNAADISAKAESRERATSIIGSLLGMLFAQHMAGEEAGRLYHRACTTVYLHY